MKYKMTIRKLPNRNIWRLYGQHNKILGDYYSLEDAMDRETQINYFKHIKKVDNKKIFEDLKYDKYINN